MPLLSMCLIGTMERSPAVIHMRQNIPGTSPYEPIIGFSRAVRIGNIIHVSGTGPVGAETASVRDQACRAFEIIGKALQDGGGGFRDVVRTRIYLTEVEDWQVIGKVHGEIFGNIRPAATMVVVAALLNPAWRVEIEVDAVLPNQEEE